MVTAEAAGKSLVDGCQRTSRRESNLQQTGKSGEDDRCNDLHVQHYFGRRMVRTCNGDVSEFPADGEDRHVENGE